MSITLMGGAGSTGPSFVTEAFIPFGMWHSTHAAYDNGDSTTNGLEMADNVNTSLSGLIDLSQLGFDPEITAVSLQMWLRCQNIGGASNLKMYSTVKRRPQTWYPEASTIASAAFETVAVAANGVLVKTAFASHQSINVVGQRFLAVVLQRRGSEAGDNYSAVAHFVGCRVFVP